MRHIKKTDPVPAGLSVKEPDDLPSIRNDAYYLVIPTIKKYARQYDINTDQLETDWWQFRIMLCLHIFQCGGFCVRLNYGWARLIKEFPYTVA